MFSLCSVSMLCFQPPSVCVTKQEPRLLILKRYVTLNKPQLSDDQRSTLIMFLLALITEVVTGSQSKSSALGVDSRYLK